MKRLIKKKRRITLDRLRLTNPQLESVTFLLAAQKNKYKKLLHQTHEKLHIIADNTASLELWYNMNGEYEFVSQSVERIIGYLPEAFYRHEVSLEKITHPDHLSLFQSDKKNALEGQAGANEYKMIAKDGAVKWVAMRWQPVITRNDKHIGVRISIEDITELTQSRLRESSTDLVLQRISEVADIGLFSTTPDGMVTSWSKGAAQLTGYLAEEILHTSVKSLMMRLNRKTEVVPDFNTALNGSNIQFSFEIKKKNGEIFLGELIFMGVRAPDNSLLAVAGILRDQSAN
jgi:PAS domain S-box-containing protein